MSRADRKKNVVRKSKADAKRMYLNHFSDSLTYHTIMFGGARGGKSQRMKDLLDRLNEEMDSKVHEYFDRMTRPRDIKDAEVLDVRDGDEQPRIEGGKS